MNSLPLMSEPAWVPSRIADFDPSIPIPPMSNSMGSLFGMMPTATSYVCPQPGCGSLILDWEMAHQHSLMHLHQQHPQQYHSEQPPPHLGKSIPTSSSGIIDASSSGHTSFVPHPPPHFSGIGTSDGTVSTAVLNGELPTGLASFGGWDSSAHSSNSLTTDSASNTSSSSIVGTDGRKRRPRDSGDYECIICGVKVSRIDSLTRHVKRKHPDQVALLDTAAGGTADTSPFVMPPILNEGYATEVVPPPQPSTSSQTTVSKGKSPAAVAAATGGAVPLPKRSLHDTAPSTSSTKSSVKSKKSAASPASSTSSGPAGKRFECSMCGTMLSRIDSLSRHMRKQHNQLNK